MDPACLLTHPATGPMERTHCTPEHSLSLFLSPGANALNVALAADAKMKALAREFPPGIAYGVPFDTTITCRTPLRPRSRLTMPS